MPVSPDDCVWTLERKTCTISVHLEKEAPVPWPYVVSGPDQQGEIDPQSLFNLAVINEGGMSRAPTDDAFTMMGVQAMLGGAATMGGPEMVIPPDEGKALLCYKQAADAGHVGAMMRLAELYTPRLKEQDVHGVPFATMHRDAELALHFYKMAAVCASPPRTLPSAAAHAFPASTLMLIAPSTEVENGQISTGARRPVCDVPVRARLLRPFVAGGLVGAKAGRGEGVVRAWCVCG